MQQVVPYQPKKMATGLTSGVIAKPMAPNCETVSLKGENVDLQNEIHALKVCTMHMLCTRTGKIAW